LSFIVGIWTTFATVLSREEKFRFNLRVGMLVLFLLQGLVSTLVAPHSDLAWHWWVEFLKWVLMTYFIVVMATDVRKFRLILVVIALSLGFESAKQGWAGLILHPGGANMNELPQLGDNNCVAVGMLMLAPILTTLGATASRKGERWFYRFLAVGVLNRGITTYSRGGFLAFIALGLTYVLRSTKRVPAILGIVLAALIILPVMPSAFWQRMGTIKPPDQIEQEDDSARGRLHFWNVAIAMANDRPLFGVGCNSYNATYDAYDDSKGWYGYNRSVHSAWFGVLAELGYPGLVLFLAQLILAFSACRRARRAAKLGGEHAILKQFAFGLEAGLVVFAVGGTFLPFQYTEMLWHWIGLTIALDGLARTALASVAVRVPAGSGAFQRAPIPRTAFVS